MNAHLLPVRPRTLLAIAWRPRWGLVFLVMGTSASTLAAPSGADLRLLIGEALRTHPVTQAQRARAQAAHAGVESARWQFWPTPYVNVDNANAGRSSAAYAGDSTVTTLGVRQPLWTGGRLTAGLDRAQAGEAAALASSELARQQLALRVTQAYGEWWAAQLKARAYATGRDVHQRLLEQVARRVEEGQSARSDRVLAEGRLASVQADLASAQAQSLVSLSRLSQLVGRPLQASDLADAGGNLPILSAPVEELLTQAREASPALAQYRAQADAEQATVEERRADVWPEVSVRVERQRGNFSQSGTSGANVVMLGLSSRFGAGLSTRSGIEEARGRHAAALAEVEVQARDLAEQVMADHALLQQSAPRRAALQAAIGASDEVRESWDRQFQVGRKTWQDLMASAREQVQIEAQLADVEAARLVSAWRLLVLCRGVDAALGLTRENR